MVSDFREDFHNWRHISHAVPVWPWLVETSQADSVLTWLCLISSFEVSYELRNNVDVPQEVWTAGWKRECECAENVFKNKSSIKQLWKTLEIVLIESETNPSFYKILWQGCSNELWALFQPNVSQSGIKLDGPYAHFILITLTCGRPRVQTQTVVLVFFSLTYIKIQHFSIKLILICILWHFDTQYIELIMDLRSILLEMLLSPLLCTVQMEIIN